MTILSGIVHLSKTMSTLRNTDTNYRLSDTETATTPLAASAAGTSLEFARGGHTHRSPGGIASITSPVTIANSTTETVLVTATIPANLMAAGTTFEVVAQGIAGTAGTAPTMTWRVRIGSDTLIGNIMTSIAPTPGTNLTNKPWMVNFTITIRTSGTSGTGIGNGFILNELSTTLAQAVKGTATTSTQTVNTTAQRLIELTFQWGTANASNTLTCHNAFIEIINM